MPNKYNSNSIGIHSTIKIQYTYLCFILTVMCKNINNDINFTVLNICFIQSLPVGPFNIQI